MLKGNSLTNPRNPYLELLSTTFVVRNSLSTSRMVSIVTTPSSIKLRRGNSPPTATSSGLSFTGSFTSPLLRRPICFVPGFQAVHSARSSSGAWLIFLMTGVADTSTSLPAVTYRFEKSNPRTRSKF
jgi:hypothetical protein